MGYVLGDKREPYCTHSLPGQAQPASMCSICKDGDDLRRWREYWTDKAPKRAQGGLITGYKGETDSIPVNLGGEGYRLSAEQARRFGPKYSKALLDKLNQAAEGSTDDLPPQADPAL